jgi:membrane-bound lytic murein transglycosylase B
MHNPNCFGGLMESILFRLPNHIFLNLLLFLLLLVGLFCPTSAECQDKQEDFSFWVEQLKTEAVSVGINRVTLEKALVDVSFLPWVIEVDRRQPEFKKSLAEYLAGAVTKQRIRQGRSMLRDNRRLLNKITAKYKVQPHYLVALWGIETNFGRNTGKVPILSALATLAYDARRSKYFRGELLNALRILDSGVMTKEQFVGSWAGAFGQLQFMPSTFLGFAVDGNQDGRIDLWQTREDYLSSAANYLRKSGWQYPYRWGRKVKLPPGFDVSLAGMDSRKSLQVWHDLGVRTQYGHILPGKVLPASLLLPEGRDGQPFLVYENYRVLMRWNRAHSFALAVGMLAEQIAAADN